MFALRVKRSRKINEVRTDHNRLDPSQKQGYKAAVNEHDALTLDRARAEELLDSLTDAQVDVLDRILMHKTSKEIARELGIAPNTVDQRLKSAWRKLGTNDRASTARRYALLKAICDRTIYGGPVVDLETLTHDMHIQGLPEGPLFVVEDSATYSPQFFRQHPTALEALDAKFGPIGRFAAIILGAALIAVIGLVTTTVAVTLGDLV